MENESVITSMIELQKEILTVFGTDFNQLNSMLSETLEIVRTEEQEIK